MRVNKLVTDHDAPTLTLIHILLDYVHTIMTESLRFNDWYKNEKEF